MSFPNINPPALKLINFFDAPIQEKVKVCTSRYTPPKNLVGYFAYLLHRVWNAVKSLFNASDWQVAKQAIIDGELKEPANLFKKMLPSDDEFTKIIATEYVTKLKGTKIPTEKQIKENRKGIAEEFLIEILECNMNPPEPEIEKTDKDEKKEGVKKTKNKPSKTTLSELVKTKEDLLKVSELREHFKKPEIQEILKDEFKLDALKEALQKTPEEERAEMLSLFVMLGIDHKTFLELQKEFKPKTA